MTSRLRRRIESDFPEPGSADEVVRLVSEASDFERVQAANVLQGLGDLPRIRSSVELAKSDRRDVLVRGDLADEDWSDMFEAELGLKQSRYEARSSDPDRTSSR